ncbi:MAG: sulfatase-like hydrolase/transferase [Pirellulaceae bacterium]|nr:sulfatase-like hydrolase/transferase [Pirellulaceae bacterium]
MTTLCGCAVGLDRTLRSLRHVILALTCVVTFTSDLAAVTAERPNIVLILCDDLGYADVGFNGSTDITTPSLDQLAKNGTIFSSAYVAHPFCGPSRMGLMTGRYPHSFGSPFNLPNSGLGIEQYNAKGIDENEPLISTVLQDAGYFTGAVGKWHMGIQPQFHPNRRGFDDFYGFLGGGHMYFPEKFAPIYQRQSKNGVEHINEYVLPLEHNGVDVEETEYITDGLSREAARFAKAAAQEDKPFFLYLAFNAPHTPLEAKAEDLAKFADIQDEKRRTYAAMVYAVDRGVGQLVDTLKSTGELENTLIVFLSDNGGKIGAGANNAPLTQGKGSICEGGFRVPMFFHWPASVPAGVRYDHPVSALDFYPTFARLAGATIASGKQIDGKDIWDAFLADRSPRQGETIFALRHWNGFHNVGIRKDQWKASKRGPNSPWNLFNLDDDISESNDLSGKHPEIVSEMVDEGRKWSQSHTQPRWFDNEKSEAAWKMDGMPKYQSTFAVD